MNPTLIPGFEDIITHIKQQEQRIKNLEQKNKEQQEENKKLDAKMLGYLADRNYQKLKYEALKEEKDNWEADDANLTKIISMINDLDDEFSVGGVDDIYDCIKDLKEEKDDLEAQVEHHEEYNRDLQQDHDDLEEENKKLKNLCADPKSVEHKNSVSNMILDNITYEDYLKMNEQMEEENKKLREENKKLKEDEEMMLSAVEVMKFGMEHKWDQKEKEWVSEEEYEERYREE